MYVFNAGGTMTESSNYDGVPPVPPAYGVWRRPASARSKRRTSGSSRSRWTADELIKNGSWMPDDGTIRQTITLSADGNSFTSRITIELFDKAGKPIAVAVLGPRSGSAYDSRDPRRLIRHLNTRVCPGTPLMRNI